MRGVVITIKVRSRDHRMRRFLARAAIALVVVAVVAAVFVTVPAALTASLGALLVGSWAWYRVTTGREARGGHIYCPDGRAMADRWQPS